MNFNKQFVESLLQKLSVGSTRSVLLNALPKKLLTRLAVSDLRHISNSLSKDFIDGLTTDPHFTFKFVTDTNTKDEELLGKLAHLSKRLSAIKYDHDDYLKEHGVATFGVGFPILIRKNPKDSSKFIAAPIFIFSLDIKQTFDKKREWVISRNSDEIRVNEVLYSFIEGNEQLKLPEISEEALADGVLDKEEIVEFVKALFAKFPGQELNLPNWNELDSLPDKLLLEDFENSRIIWDGVFSLYKGQKQSLIKDLSTVADHISNFSTQPSAANWQHAHSPMPTDPSQNGVLRSVSSNQNIVIQGPPGTGKSQTLTAIITGAISQNKRVLVVCEKRTALEVLEANLNKLIPELSEYIAVIEDVSKDRAAIVENVRNRTAKHLVSIHAGSIAEDVRRFEDRAQKVEQQYRELRKPILSGLKLKDLTAKWLKINKNRTDIDVLYQYQSLFAGLNVDDAKIVNCEDRLREACSLFSNIQADNESLNNNIVVTRKIGNNYDKEFIQKLKGILSDIESEKEKLIIEWAGDIHHNRQNAVVEANKVTSLINEVDELAVKWQSKNIPKVSLFERLAAVFSKRNRQYVVDSKIIIDKLVSLQRLTRGNNVSLETIDSFRQNKSIILNLVSQQIELDVARYKELPLKQTAGDAASRLARIMSLLSDAGALIKLPALNEDLVGYSDMLSYLAHTSKSINALLSKAPVLRNYFSWLAFEGSLDEFEHKWVECLKEIPCNKWLELYRDSLIYYSLLSVDDTDRFPVSDDSIKLLSELGIKIQANQKQQILANLNNWFLQAQNTIKSTGLTVNQIYNLRGSKGQTRNSLRKIVSLSYESFINFFPILLLNPTTCSSILPLTRGLFDLVIFDEASQLRIEDTFSALIRGKQIVVSGDSLQMPPSNYFESNNYTVEDTVEEEDEEAVIDSQLQQMAFRESLLEYAVDSGFKETYLDMHYRSKHPDLIEFSNVCFYNSRLVPMPATQSTSPIVFRRVDGLSENRGNRKEAEEVLRILKEDVSEQYSIGIATFNLLQRNLILTLIDEERSRDSAFNSKMLAIELKGFFVKNLENIQGDERDIIILSTTFGVTPKNTFRLHFGPVTSSNGHRLLNVILTRSRVKMYVLTSIPENRIPEYRERLSASRKVDGTTGLLAYLDYAKAVSSNDVKGKEDILSYISVKLSAGSAIMNRNLYQLTESPFEQEVVSWLSEVVPAERLELQHKCGGFRIDIVVHPKPGTIGRKLAIECDGAAYHSDELAWHYDIYRQKQLEHEFNFHRIWSTNWWRNPEEEFSKLLTVINAMN